MSETDIMRRLQKLASDLGARLFRQNSGMAWVGKAQRFDRAQSVHVKPGDVLVRAARPFHAGVPGMSDLGGWTPVAITPDMVGATLAVYTAVEVKAGTSATQQQRAFIDAVRSSGGYAGIARNDDDLSAILSGK